MRPAKPACSFCGKSKPEIGALVKGRKARICDRCIRHVASEHATVAYCAECKVRGGSHAVDCPEWRRS